MLKVVDVYDNKNKVSVHPFPCSPKNTIINDHPNESKFLCYK